jgi:YegS/Rv2252/BmrU family lipid kinase
VERALREHGLELRREDTRDLEHARALALQVAQSGETVVGLSGDGMIGALADALRTVPDALLGVLPGGRGNDLARVLGIPRDPVAACATIAGGVPYALDLGEVVGGRAFVGIASAGFDSEANRIANEAPSLLGNLVYAYGALRTLLSWRPARFQIELDPPGERLELHGYTVAAANSQTYGGGMRLAPHAHLDDGLLDVIAIERVGKLRFLANLPKVFTGAHVELPSVRELRAAEVKISADRPFTLYTDGDPAGELPVRVRALPGAVRVLVPAAFASAGAPLRSSPASRPGSREDHAAEGDAFAGRASAEPPQTR